MTDDNKTAPGNDDWLDDLGGGEEADDFGELDQSTIDQLLGGSGENAGQQAAPKENGTTGGGEEAGEFDELDQSSIDQLLGGSGENAGQQAAPKEHGTTGGGSVEIDQASLDALLNGDDPGDSNDFFSSGSGGGADAAAPLDQSSINALFGNDDEDFQAALEDSSSNVPSQSDIDELFAQAQEVGDEPPGPADDDVDLDDLFAEGPQAGSPAAGEDDFGFDTAAFPMDEATAPGKRAAMPRADEDATLDEDIFGDETILEPTIAAAAGVKPWRKVLPVHLLAGASRRSLWGGLLAAVVMVGGGVSFVVLRDRTPEPIAPPPVAMEVLAPETAPAVVNTPPEAKGVEFRMPEAGGEVPLLLAARDQEGDALAYEITTPPQHGRLAGELPTPIYLPNNDFPGQDLVEYRVSDGKDYSKPASVLITGPDLRPEADTGQPGMPVAMTRQPILHAHDITLRTLSTRKLVIDWQKIWQQANTRPFSPEVRVEIVGKDLHGELKTIDPRKHHYRPDRRFCGSDSISYRFRLGEAASQMAELRLLVEPGDFPPEIRFREAPAESYLVGETVVLDAGPTLDDDPATLSFSWLQVGGTPVKLEQLNADGSRVSFVVPSSFYTQENPGPVLRLTATDRSGQKTEEIVKIATRSRRQSPLWQGVALNGGLIGAEARPGPSALRPGIVNR